MVDLTVRDPKRISDILVAASARREIIILSTPYLRIESVFLRYDGSAIHASTVAIPMEDVRYGLKSADLKMHFPAEGRFFEASTKFLGLGNLQGKQTLRFAMPEVLSEEDKRGTYRTDKTSRISPTFSTPKYSLLTATLVNLSVSGARIHSHKELDPYDVAVGKTILITVPINDEIRIETRAIIRYANGRSIGVEFLDMNRDKALVDRLSRWVFQRKEEALRAASASSSVDGIKNLTAHPLEGAADGIVLLSGDPAVAECLKVACASVTTLHISGSDMQASKALAASSARHLVVFHVKEMTREYIKRIRVILDPIRAKYPVILIGTTIEQSDLTGIAGDLQAAGSHHLNTSNPSVLFVKILQWNWIKYVRGDEKQVAPRKANR